jgi:succinyl-diaminopimelate desuccinylase
MKLQARLMTEDALDLAKQLIARQSVTPNDDTCQEIIASRLAKIGFNSEKLKFGEVDNLYARKGNHEPMLLFAGHTDVVPPGPVNEWSSPPFEPTIRGDRLYGRGAVDMKGALAAMVCACESFIEDYPHHQGSIGFLITSDEEGEAVHGTVKVVEELIARNEVATWCIVGEASSENQFGDSVRVGRRGSLSGKLTVYGKQGHIAYPHIADNPIHKSLFPLHTLATTVWDEGNPYFIPTSFQISNINAGIGANNVIPGELSVRFNFRFSPEVTATELKQRFQSILDDCHLAYDLTWSKTEPSFLSNQGKLFAATCEAVEKIVGLKPKATTGGGTSDGRFIINMGCELLELGFVNTSAHQIDENVSLQELSLLTKVYYEILVNLLG